MEHNLDFLMESAHRMIEDIDNRFRHGQFVLDSGNDHFVSFNSKCSEVSLGPSMPCCLSEVSFER